MAQERGSAARLTLRRRCQRVSACARLVADACGEEASDRRARGCAGRLYAHVACARVLPAS